MKTNTKAKRFFFHYRKQTGGMTVHWDKQCIPVNDVVCNVPIETKWNNEQPRLVLRGFAKEVRIENGCAIIS